MIYFNRQSIRLRNFDYGSYGYYFVTICTHNRQCIFGSIIDGKIILNDVGKMVDIWINKISEKFSNTTINTYIIMPDHIHFIIIVGAIPCNRPTMVGKNNRPTTINKNNFQTMHVNNNHQGENMVSPLHDKQQIPNTYNGLGQYISWFKRMSTNEHIRHVKNDNWPMFDHKLWQRNYYEHIIRNEKEYFATIQYINDNPIN